MHSVENERVVFVEQIKMLVNQTQVLIWMTLISSAVIFLLLLDKVPIHIPVVWLSSIILFTGVRLWHYHRYTRDKITVDNARIHGAIYVFFSFLIGIFWGSLGLFLPILSDPLMQILLAVLLCGLIAGAVAYLSVYSLVYYAFAIPCVLPFAIRCILSQHETLVPVGFLLLFLLCLNLFNSQRGQKNILTGINLVRENMALIAKLKDEKINAEEARNIADHNNEAKSHFLAAASHDLRQPLHAMVFFVEALQLEKDPAKIKNLIKKIAQTSEALRNLLGSLLDISKIEAGGMEPDRTHFNLNELLMEVIQEFTELANEKALNLSYDPCVRTVHSDKEMLGRILRNLVSNAIHYTDIGYVNISCEVENGYVIIHVSDSGIGIPENNKKDIFREFFQINEGEDEPSHGLGLGLSIVDGLCGLLGHEISLKSELSAGSIFSVKIPQGNLNLVNLESHEPDILPGDVIAKTIILNNELASLESISGIMRHWGHIVADFNTCTEVMEFLATEDFIPDLVISDIKLRDASGIEAIEAIQVQIAKKIPGIIMTGEGSGAVTNKVRSNGFSVLQKPVQPAKLRSIVSYLVQGERLS